MRLLNVVHGLEKLFTEKNDETDGYGFVLVPPNQDVDTNPSDVSAELQTYVTASERETNETFRTEVLFSVLCRVGVGEGTYDLTDKVHNVVKDFRKMSPDFVIDVPNPDYDVTKDADGDGTDSDGNTREIEWNGLAFVGMSNGPGFPLEAQYVFPLLFTYSFLETVE